MAEKTKHLQNADRKATNIRMTFRWDRRNGDDEIIIHTGTGKVAMNRKPTFKILHKRRIHDLKTGHQLFRKVKYVQEALNL